jgi:hypothetical protein
VTTVGHAPGPSEAARSTSSKYSSIPITRT